MLDPHLLKTQTSEIVQRLATRGFSFDAEEYLALETKRKALQIETQALQNERNQRSKALGLAIAQKEERPTQRKELAQLGDTLNAKKDELAAILTQLEAINLSLPNLPHESVPIGKTERDNQEIRRWGIPPTFDFEPLAHDVLGERAKLMDFATAAKITGSRFVVLKHALAKLHRALIQLMLDTHTMQGYQEIYVPYIVNADSLRGTGQLPKFEEDLFKLTGDSPLYLTSTAEVPVTNTIRDMIIAYDHLPIRYVCHTPCFRSEAGSYGKDTKGMIRQHQFEKVELVWITQPEASYDALERLTHDAELILQRLGLPYRVVELCTGDLGAGAAKTYDIEVWLPSQKMYREISSCSNTEAFQARRMHARYRDPKTNETAWVHTLNGSALAVGRTLVAILENFQQQDGSVIIPEILYPYMGGMTTIL